MIFQLLTFVTLLTTSISFKIDEKKFLDEPNNDKVIYVDVSLNDTLKNNNPYLHYVNGETEQNINLILDSSDIYHTESAISFDAEGKYTICCDTDYVVEYINVETLSKVNYNYVCVIENGSAEYGYYGTRLTNPGASYRTQRVWLDNTNHYFSMDDYWGGKNTTTIGYSYNNTWNVIEMATAVNTYDKHMYYYADIPSDVTSVNFMAMSNSENHSCLVTKDCPVDALMYGVCYNINDGWLGDGGATTCVVEGADATLLSMVVEAYLTYGKDYSNGSYIGTVKNLFFTWFEYKSASSNDLKNAKILDYTGYSANGNSYENLEKGSSFSVNEKWNTMCSQAGIDPKTGKARSFNLSWLDGNTGKFVIYVGGVSFIVVLSLSVLLFIKHKRKQD